MSCRKTLITTSLRPVSSAGLMPSAAASISAVAVPDWLLLADHEISISYAKAFRRLA